MSTETPLPLDTSAYLSDTGHLSTLEHGAYLLILMALWRTKDGWIDGSDKFLARATRMTVGRWKRIAQNVRALLVSKDGKVSQKRVQKELNHQRVSRSKVSPGENPNREAKSLKNKDPIPKTPEMPPTASQPLSFFLEPKIDSSIGSKEDSKKKKRGSILPIDWKPSAASLLRNRTVLHLSDDDSEIGADQMRRWARAEAHRAIAHKSDWDACYDNWMDRYAADKFGRGRSRSPPARRVNGHTATLMKLLNDEELFNDQNHGTVVDHQRALSAPARR